MIIRFTRVGEDMPSLEIIGRYTVYSESGEVQGVGYAAVVGGALAAAAGIPPALVDLEMRTVYQRPPSNLGIKSRKT